MTTGIFDFKIRNNVRPSLLTIENSPIDLTDAVNKQYVDTAIASAVSASAITITGDASASGTHSLNLTLSNTGVTAGQYVGVTVDAKGRVTAGANLTVTGDVTGISSGTNIALTLNNSGVTAGTYSKLTVNAKGLVTNASVLASSDITTALGFTPVSTAGGTITGNFTVSGNLYVTANPTDTNQVVNKQYVDSKVWLALAVGL